MNVPRSVGNNPGLLADGPQAPGGRSTLSEYALHRMISRERRRTERSHKPFLLMLLDMGEEPAGKNGESCLAKILDVLLNAMRETDAVGWYRNGVVVGVMFTEIDPAEKNHILKTMLVRVSAALADRLSFEQFNELNISFHWFPEEWGNGVPKRPSNPVLYPDLANQKGQRGIAVNVKRLIDIVGSATALLTLSPLFLVIALAVKLTSKGPVIFRQERMGQFGAAFECLKFRTMYENNDVAIHKQFMNHLIHGNYPGTQDEHGNRVYKMTDDPRITRVGRFLRRTSLDELPQLINVLKGEMSLVGPRPPLAYEFQQYDIWHRRRVLEIKPGITGLWQVNGRSRVGFDEMVRLDLRYVRSWSHWLDLQIVLQTPKAVFWGHDAF